MKNLKSTQKLVSLLLVSCMALILSACSGDQAESTGSAGAGKTKENHVDYGEASDSVKNKFIKVFSQNCVAREVKNATNKDIEEKRATDSCTCIATHIAENLAEVDAEKYLDDHEDTHTLEIKFDTAAYFCLQNKPQPKGPHLFGKPQN